jgi:mRNA-degrading endonuclease toxin of MazEF toxin-antitoxin module
MAILRSQIYFVNLNPTAGREQSGTRPVLVLSIDDINRIQVTILRVSTSNYNLMLFLESIKKRTL